TEIEPLRRLAYNFRVEPDGFFQVAALLLLGVGAVVDPAQAVAGNFPVGFLHGCELVGRTREGRSDGIDRYGNGSRREHAVEPPEACAGSIFVDRLHVPMAHAFPRRGADHFREEGFGCGIAMQDTVSATFLVVADELHSDVGSTWPFRVWRVGSIAAHVPTVAFHLFHFSALDRFAFKNSGRIVPLFPLKNLNVFPKPSAERPLILGDESTHYYRPAGSRVIHD